MTISQAVILAGGKGERLKPYTEKMPKALYPISGVPFLEYLIKQIRTFGIKEILILTGYLSDKIVDTIGDGSRFGIHIIYDESPLEYGTADRLRHAGNFLQENYLLMYCDNYCPVDFHSLVEKYSSNNAEIQISVYSNKDKYTKDNLMVDPSGRVTVYDKARNIPNLSGVDIGYAIVRRDVIDYLSDDQDSFASLYPILVRNGTLYATVTDHRYYSIGSFERMQLTEEFFTGKRAAFLDRDGVLNVKPPKAHYVKNPDEFVWIEGAKDAVKLLNDAGIVTILFTNQPGIARGLMSEKNLKSVEAVMNDELARAGAKMDYSYYCLHDWNEGCDCRKPKPGLLYQAQKDLSLNLTNCIVFGDDERDIKAGRSAGCETVLITEKYNLLQAVQDFLMRIEN